MEITRLRNVGLISHGGAGKTSLTEAILFNTKTTDRLGRVDNGTATTDYLEEEIERKISISSSLAQANWGGYKINIIDTPGYMDFVGEVKRALRVVEGVIVVIDAVSGLEVGTEIVWNMADEENLPRIVFINKMDKENASFHKSYESIKNGLNANVIPIQLPIGEEGNFRGVIDLIGQKAYVYKDGDFKIEEIRDDLKDKSHSYREKLIEAIVETDDTLTEKYLEGKELTEEELRKTLSKAIKEQKLIPVLCGSAYNNIGIHPLLDNLIEVLPDPFFQKFIIGKNESDEEEKREISVNEPFSSLVFKVMTDPYVGDLTLFRVFSGKVRTGQEIYNSTKGEKERIGHICQIHGKQRREVGEIVTGDVGAVIKLRNVSTSDTLCDPAHPIRLKPIDFPNPTISIAVNPKTKQDQEKLSIGLSHLEDEDPTFRVKLEHELGQTIISGMGEIHLEVMIDRLRKRFGIEVNLEKPKIPYRETIKKTAKGEGKYKRQSGGRGQYGHAFLEIEPKPRGEGFEFVNEIFGGAIPAKYIPAIEKGVKEAMNKGILAGYPVIDTKVRLYDGSFHTVDSSDLAFNIAASLAFKNAFNEASPVLLEPIMQVEVMAPEEYMGDIISDLNGRRGKIQGMEPKGTIQIIKALVPQAEMYKYSTNLRSITRGRGIFNMEFSHYEEVPSHLAQKIIEESKK
ncbi:MAG: elongation factor G [bacterium]|nr:elongation factor G [bacterium]